MIALLLACLFGVAGAAPAQAHDQLVQSSPAPEAALDASPTAEITTRSALDVPRMLLIGGLGALVALGVAWVVVRSRKVPTPAADADSTASADSTDAR